MVIYIVNQIASGVIVFQQIYTDEAEAIAQVEDLKFLCDEEDHTDMRSHDLKTGEYCQYEYAYADDTEEV